MVEHWIKILVVFDNMVDHGQKEVEKVEKKLVCFISMGDYCNPFPQKCNEKRWL